MNTRYINIFVIFCFIVLITGCSNQASIKSATPDKVVIKAQPNNFTEAYQMAQKECQKNTKDAEYIPDDIPGLEEVAFNCVGEEVATETEEAPEETEEVPTETEEIPAESEEVPAESEEVSSE